MNLGYTGKPYDPTTGLYNYGYRDYKPEAARFTTMDPVRDGSNWFAYVNNDPVNWVDPWGLKASDPKNNWIDNGNGTYTAKQGAALSGLYGVDWQEQSGFTRDPRTLQIGETVGTPKPPTPDPTPAPVLAPKAPAAFVPTPVVPTPTAYAVPVLSAGATMVVGGNATLSYVYDTAGNKGIAISGDVGVGVSAKVDLPVSAIVNVLLDIGSKSSHITSTPGTIQNFFGPYAVTEVHVGLGLTQNINNPKDTKVTFNTAIGGGSYIGYTIVIEFYDGDGKR
jgi:RHS repeat-associated protein